MEYMKYLNIGTHISKIYADKILIRVYTIHTVTVVLQLDLDPCTYISGLVK